MRVSKSLTTKTQQGCQVGETKSRKTRNAGRPHLRGVGQDRGERIDTLFLEHTCQCM
jgi:hypothetical protein